MLSGSSHFLIRLFQVVFTGKLQTIQYILQIKSSVPTFLSASFLTIFCATCGFTCGFFFSFSFCFLLSFLASYLSIKEKKLLSISSRLGCLLLGFSIFGCLASCSLFAFSALRLAMFSWRFALALAKLSKAFCEIVLPPP